MRAGGELGMFLVWWPAEREDDEGLSTLSEDFDRTHKSYKLTMLTASGISTFK